MQLIEIETSKAIYSALALARESPPSLAFGRDTGRGRVGRRRVADEVEWEGRLQVWLTNALGLGKLGAAQQQAGPAMYLLRGEDGAFCTWS